MKDYMSARRNKRRVELIGILGGVCVRCGTSQDLEFDHIVPGSQDFRISGRGLDKPWDQLVTEVAKCQLLCSSCHHKKTTESYETLGGWNANTSRIPEHGTAACYSRLKCRCAACRKAKQLYRAKLVPYLGNIEKSTVSTTELVARKRASNKLKQTYIRSIPVEPSFDVDLAKQLHKNQHSPALCPCGNPAAHGSLFCSAECRKRYSKPRPSKKPPEQELLYIASGMSLSAAGRFFGVSDNAVRKWLKSFGYDPSNLPRREDLFTFKGGSSLSTQCSCDVLMPKSRAVATKEQRLVVAL